jgi:hypothetical protein
LTEPEGQGRPLSALMFVAANVAAGALNYVFQVIASRTLDKAAFGDLSLWLAKLSIAAVIASVAQYTGTLLPVSGSTLRVAATALAASTVVLSLVAWLLPDGSPGLMLALALAFGIANGWVTGQAQNRLLLATFAAAALIVPIVKISIALAPIGHWTGVDRFYGALALGYAPAVVFVAVRLMTTRAAAAGRKTGESLASGLSAALVLAFAAAAFPQIDLIVVKATQDPATFQTFARVSLFYKAVFFLFLIAANWLLPYDIRDRAPRFLRLDSVWLFPAGLLVSAAMAVVSPFVSSLIMHWDEAPPARLVFLACENMCLLSWIFLIVQSACARKRIRPGVLLLGGLVATYALVRALSPSIATYFVVTIAASTAMLTTYITSSVRRPR